MAAPRRSGALALAPPNLLGAFVGELLGLDERGERLGGDLARRRVPAARAADPLAGAAVVAAAAGEVTLAARPLHAMAEVGVTERGLQVGRDSGPAAELAVRGRGAGALAGLRERRGVGAAGVCAVRVRGLVLVSVAERDALGLLERGWEAAACACAWVACVGGARERGGSED